MSGTVEGDAALYKGSTLTVSMAMVETGAALQSFLGPRSVLPFEHIAANLGGHAEDAPYSMPSLLMPLYVEGGLGRGGHISIIPHQRFGWVESYKVCREIHEKLKESLTEKGADTTSNAEGSFPAPEGPGVVDEAIEAILGAMEAAGKTAEDVTIAVAPNGGTLCEVTEEEVPPPEGAEEGTEPTMATVYTYNYGEPKRTAEAIEYLVGLQEKGVSMLLDPFHVEDPGLHELAAALHTKSKGFVLGGNAKYQNDATRVTSAAQKAVDPDDGETRPWASCVAVDLCETGSVSEAAKVARAMFDTVRYEGGPRSQVILQNGQPHVAVGLQADFVRVGALTAGDGVAQYNELCRIEQHLQKAKRLKPRA